MWIRETLVPGASGLVRYEYDGALAYKVPDLDTPVDWPWKVRKIVPRYMPRWACRSYGEIVEVRVERVQDITLDDMRAEGVRPTTEASLLWRETLADNFRNLWNDINAERGYGWDVNPWVWALTLKRI